MQKLKIRSTSTPVLQGAAQRRNLGGYIAEPGLYIPAKERALENIYLKKSRDRRGRAPEGARAANVGRCRRGAAERGRKGRQVIWAVGAGIPVACEPRATLRSHLHRLEASYGSCCMCVPHVAQHVVFVASELQISSNGTVCGSAGQIALCSLLVMCLRV